MKNSTTPLKWVFAAACAAHPYMAAAQVATAPLQKGEVIYLDVDYTLTKISSVDETPGTQVCLRRGSKLEVIHGESDSAILQRRGRWITGNENNTNLSTSCDSPSLTLPPPGDDPALYKVDPTALKRDYYRHRGITHGALFVPFKRRSDKSLSGESNLGYYLGYRFGIPWGLTFTPAVSAGMSLVNVSDDSATTANSVKDAGIRAAFTMAGGIILTHLDAFQVGIFVGQDRIGGDAGAIWKHEGRTWTSIAFGYAFSR